MIQGSKLRYDVPHPQFGCKNHAKSNFLVEISAISNGYPISSEILME